jgi:aminoglycoside phosphotransferase (APT) family kinase protein
MESLLVPCEPEFELIVRNALLSEFPEFRVESVQQLYGGISAKTALVNGEFSAAQPWKLVVRKAGDWSYERDRDPVGTQFRLLKALGEVGISANPAVAHIRYGTDLGDEVLVTEYMEGGPVFSPPDLSDYLKQYAAAIASIHRVSLESLSNVGLRTQEVKFRPPEPNTPHFDLELKVRSQMEACPAPLQRTFLRHGDCWPGNILWQNGRLSAIIDWEEAVLGDPLSDLGVCRFDLFILFGWEAMEEFTAHYLEFSGFDSEWIPWWDLWASLRPAPFIPDWSSVYPGLGRPDVTTESITRDLYIFAEAALRTF